MEITGTFIAAPTPPDTLTPPSSEVSPAAFLLFLKHKLSGLDEQISSLQHGMRDQLTEQNRLQGINRTLEHLQAIGGAAGDSDIISDGHGADLIDHMEPSAWLEAHQDVARVLGVTRDASGAWPNQITGAQISAAKAHVDAAISSTKQDMEIRMIEFQNLMQDRSSTVQLVSNCINSMNEATKGIVGNIR